MKSFIQTTLIIFIFFLSPHINANEQEKNFSIGLGTYSVSLNYDESSPPLEDDEFSGGAISLTYAFSNNIAMRGYLFATEHDKVSTLKASGTDIALLAGTGFSTNGFKIYGGGGLFTEAWEASGTSVEEDFSGIQFVGGLGYNWEIIAIDLSLALREAQGYADFISRTVGGSGTVFVSVVAFTVSARF